MIHALTFAAYAVTLDGKTVLPRTRAAVLGGHVLLPIRTVGNALGADIGYDGPSRIVTVQRGSHVARIHLNCPECVVGGRAYVPLRDVATAFGLNVGYDAGARVVALRRAQDDGGVARVPRTQPVASAPITPPPGVSYVQPTTYTVSLQPASGAEVHDPYPAISARFAGATSIDPSSLHVIVDGRDVSAEAAVIGDQVLFTPRRALSPGAHDVIVSGRDTNGTPIAQQWSFSDNFTFVAAPAPTPFPIGAIWIDRWIVPETNAFDVYVAGAQGITGYIGVDGIGGFFPLIVNSATTYVAHVIVPPGLYQPNARVAARITLPNGELTTIVLPQRITHYTKPVAPGYPYATATPVPRGVPVRRSVTVPSLPPSPGATATPPRRNLLATPLPAPTAAPTAAPSRAPVRAPVRFPLQRASPLPSASALPKPTPSVTPSPVSTRRPVIRHTPPPSPPPQ